MTYNEKVRAKETVLLAAVICDCMCEVVEIDGVILLYADGYCMGELYEEESAADYVSVIEEILI